ncbi:MAG: phosphatase PAP2 family protein [Bacteroidota bacterium]|nr:phosphatase PAP2 family protein [Bacteroidota bacterium]
MIKRWLYLPLLIAFFSLLSFAVSGQETGKITNPNSDTTIDHVDKCSQYFKPVSLIVPGTFLIYGALKPAITGIQNLDNNIMAEMKNKHPDFHTNADDYLMWAPSASIYAMDAFKVKTRHSFKEHLLLDAGSIIITGGIGYVMRNITANIKEYNTQNTEFPSGHTANAFRGAEIIHQELKESHKILSYSGYLVATTEGALRIYNKNHFLTEVLAGAGLGILSTKLTYWIFDHWKYRKNRN